MRRVVQEDAATFAERHAARLHFAARPLADIDNAGVRVILQAVP